MNLEMPLGMIRNSRVGSPTFLAVCFRKFSSSMFPSSRSGTLPHFRSGSKRKLRLKHGCYLDGHGRRLVSQTRNLAVPLDSIP